MENIKTVGTFHTHPIVTKGKISFLSDADIYSEVTDKSEFACHSAVENNIPKIKCYLPNYGMEKSIVELRNNYKEKYDIKAREYSPGGTSIDMLRLPPDKRKELVIYIIHFLLQKKTKSRVIKGCT